MSKTVKMLSVFIDICDFMRFKHLPSRIGCLCGCGMTCVATSSVFRELWCGVTFNCELLMYATFDPAKQRTFKQQKGAAMTLVTNFLVTILVVSLWTILIRAIPLILTKGIEQRVERRNNEKLEELKATLQASYTSVGTSVGFLSTAQPELRSKMIASVEGLWESILSFKDKHNEIMILDSILLTDEIEQGLNSKGQNFVWQIMQKYKDDSAFVELMKHQRNLSSEADRLFVGDRLWIIFRTISRVYGRFGFLVHKSAKEEKYQDWRKDKHFQSILLDVLSVDVVDAIKCERFGGLSTAIVYLEAEYLKESSRVMSGSEGFSEALSDIQAAVKYETARIEQERAARGM